MDWRLALKVECPLCREGPGKPCVTWATVDGKKRVMSESVHPDRAAVVIEEHQRTALSVLTQENEQLRAELEVHRAASAECNDALRELAELKAQKHDKQWPAPQPIETAPCETVILAYDAEYKVWEKMYTRRTSPAVRAKKRYPVWLPMPPPPQGT